MVLDLLDVIKCEGDTDDDGAAVKDTLYSASIVEVLVCITELSSSVFSLLKLAFGVPTYDFSTVDDNSVIEDTLATFVVNGNS